MFKVEYIITNPLEMVENQVISSLQLGLLWLMSFHWDEHILVFLIQVYDILAMQNLYAGLWGTFF